jgi:oligoendopeptidase F
VALNAGFDDFRDYQFSALGRFDYTPEDCKQWHSVIAEHIMPLVQIIQTKRAQELHLKRLRPWDLSVEPTGAPALHPFKDGADLLAKTKRGFKRLDPDFATYLETMEALGHFDLESRKSKAPGGFNYPLYEVGAPFIFMNAVGTQRDLETMVHEGGHALHSFLSHDLGLNEFKSTPAEVAELASMSMELISMDIWDEFYSENEPLNRAKAQKIEDSIMTLPWVATVDKFQHWLYENPKHTRAERRAEWIRINEIFSTGLIDYSGHETAYENAWQKQMHIFEVPFYYIEYGFAQMGAISIWKNWQQDATKALADYKAFMELGYTKPIPEIYEAAGIKFDFSDDYVQVLSDFMRLQLDQTH